MYALKFSSNLVASIYPCNSLDNIIDVVQRAIATYLSKPTYEDNDSQSSLCENPRNLVGQMCRIFSDYKGANSMHILRLGQTASGFGQCSAETEGTQCEITFLFY